MFLLSDPQCFAVDAFSLPAWAIWKFYAFSPFSIINLVLQKIFSDNATGLIIVPNWPTQPRYPKLIKLIIKSPVFILGKRIF